MTNEGFSKMYPFCKVNIGNANHIIETRAITYLLTSLAPSASCSLITKHALIAKAMSAKKYDLLMIVSFEICILNRLLLFKDNVCYV